MSFKLQKSYDDSQVSNTDSFMAFKTKQKNLKRLDLSETVQPSVLSMVFTISYLVFSGVISILSSNISSSVVSFISTAIVAILLVLKTRYHSYTKIAVLVILLINEILFSVTVDSLKTELVILIMCKGLIAAYVLLISFLPNKYSLLSYIGFSIFECCLAIYKTEASFTNSFIICFLPLLITYSFYSQLSLIDLMSDKAMNFTADIAADNRILNNLISVFPEAFLVVKDKKILKANQAFKRKFYEKLLNEFNIYPLSEISSIIQETNFEFTENILSETVVSSSFTEMMDFSVTEIESFGAQIFLFKNKKESAKNEKTDDLLIGKISHEFITLIIHMKEKIRKLRSEFVQSDLKSLSFLVKYLNLLVDEVLTFMKGNEIVVNISSLDVSLEKVLNKALKSHKIYRSLNKSKEDVNILLEGDPSKVKICTHYSLVKKCFFHWLIYLTKLCSTNEIKLSITISDQKVSLTAEIVVRDKSINNLENRYTYSKDQGLFITRTVLDKLIKSLKIEIKEELYHFKNIMSLTFQLGSMIDNQETIPLSARGNFYRLSNKNSILSRKTNIYCNIDDVEKAFSCDKLNEVLHSIPNQVKKKNTLNDSFRSAPNLSKMHFLDCIPSEIESYYLLVDDDEIILNSTKFMLQKILKAERAEDYYICKFKDGAEMLAFFYFKKFDHFRGTVKLVITDQFMNFIDGSDACSILKKKMQNGELMEFPIVCCTAFTDEFNLSRIREARVDLIVNKPIEKDSLTNLMKELNLL